VTIARAKAKRCRFTKIETARLHEGLIDIVTRLHPITVRGTFYQAETFLPDLVAKTEKGYGVVQRHLVILRERGAIPYRHITDGTRWRRGHTRYESMGDFQASVAELYRRDYWARSETYVEIWIEKDALAGTIYPVVVEEWGLDLMVPRGFSSLTYLYEAAEYLRDLDKATNIYVLSDFDASGKSAARNIEKRLRQWAPGVVLYVHDLAVTARQIRRWKLPTRPAKTGPGTHGAEQFIARHGDRSVELDAIPPDRLRKLVGDAIARHADRREIETLKEVEAMERETIAGWGADDVGEEEDDDES
jgi:hypothetical protein